MSDQMYDTLYDDHIRKLYARADSRVYRGLSARIKRRIWNRNFSEHARWLLAIRILILSDTEGS